MDMIAASSVVRGRVVRGTATSPSSFSSFSREEGQVLGVVMLHSVSRSESVMSTSRSLGIAPDCSVWIKALWRVTIHCTS